MPNWTTNKITLKGIGTNKALYDERGDFDFDKIIPAPKSAEECKREYGEKYLDDGTKFLLHSVTDTWFDWYSWNCDFWGTKWGACDTYIYSDDEVVFSTAWNEPLPIFEQLSEMYPDETLYIEASYEDGYEVERQYKNGEMIYYDERQIEWDGDE